MGKKHPLDIFRTSAAGFETASRERRTMLGRVVASAPRQAPAPAAPSAPATATNPTAKLPPAVAATRARVLGPAVPPPPAPATGERQRVELPAAARPLRPPAPPPRLPPGEAVAESGAETPRAAAPTPRPAPRPAARPAAPAPGGSARLPFQVNRILMVSACVLVGGLALWTLFSSLDGTPALKGSVPAAAPTGAQAGAQVFRVRAAAYAGTPVGQQAAFDARNLLRQQGFADVDVMAWPGSTPGSFARFDLVVGKAGGEAGLAQVLQSLRSLKNWPGGPKSPFKDAVVVSLPAR